MIFALITKKEYEDVVLFSGSKMGSVCGADQALRLFMSHSDCDGKWTPKECKTIAVMMRRVLKKTKHVEDDGGHIGNWHDTTMKFIEGLEYCAKHKQSAMFG